MTWAIAQKPLPPSRRSQRSKRGSPPQLQPCDPGPPPGGRGGRSRARGWSTALREGLQPGMLQLLPEGIADHFLPAAWLRPRHGRANCHLEKAAGPGLGHQFITLPTSPLPLPRPIGSQTTNPSA